MWNLDPKSGRRWTVINGKVVMEDEMVQLNLLTHVNGGAPHIVSCANCGTELENEKAAPRCPDGKVRFFCVPDPERHDPPEYSCFGRWCLRTN